MKVGRVNIGHKANEMDSQTNSLIFWCYLKRGACAIVLTDYIFFFVWAVTDNFDGIFFEEH